MTLILTIVNVLFLLYIIVERYLELLYILQLEKYKFKQFIHWFIDHLRQPFIYVPIILSLVQLIFIARSAHNIYLLLLNLLLCIGFIPYIRTHRKNQKVKFVITYRIKRLMAASIVVSLLFYGLTYLITRSFYKPMELLLVNAVVINFLIFDVLLIAFTLMKPIEQWIQTQFLNQAQDKLRNYQPDVIGITGSYGKTSTKNLVTQLLSPHIFVCQTPKSFNTPMGVAITVNNHLRKFDQALICEMGATKSGDIEELAQLVNPKMGIVTAIGPQHLDSFVNMSSIIKTKFELIENLPQNGIAILNMDNRFIRGYKIKNQVRVLRYGVESEDLDYRAIHIKYGSFGSQFVVEFPDQEQIRYQTRLLGKHNIYNILAAIVVADLYGINRKELQLTIESLEPIDHRLELKELPEFTIIDDAFNSNVDGFRHALDVLQTFSNQKVIITPGLIDLGDKHYAINHRLAEFIAPVCDYVVLVGKKQTEPIYDGLIEHGYPRQQIYITNDFNDGYNRVVQQFKKDFTLLIENDLPDNYTER